MKLPWRWPVQGMSKGGSCLSLVYIIAAILLFHDAMTCGGLLCDLSALLVWLPAGILYFTAYNLLDKWFVFGDIGATAAPARQWLFIIPTVITNAVIYYFIGYGISAALTKVFESRRKIR
jgi:hypothetical protein